MDPMPQLADAIADLPAAEGGVNNDNLFEPMPPPPAAAEGGVNNDNLIDANAAAAEGRGGLYDLDFDQPGDNFSEDMAEICSDKAAAVGFTAGTVNFYKVNQHYNRTFGRLRGGIPYVISVLLTNGGRHYYDSPSQLLTGIRHAIKLGYAPRGVNLSCLVDADSIQNAMDIGYPENVALIYHPQPTRSGTTMYRVSILHLTQCFLVQSHSEMCEKLGIPLHQITAPSVLEKVIQAGDSGLPFLDGWSLAKESHSTAPPRSIFGRVVIVGDKTGHEIAKTVPQQLFRDTLWSFMELQKKLSGKANTALYKVISKALCDMNNSTFVISWNSLHNCLVEGQTMNYFVVKMMIKYWGAIYEEQTIECPMTASRMYLLFSRSEVGETISEEMFGQLLSKGIIVPAVLYEDNDDEDNDEVAVGQKRHRSSTNSSRLAYTSSNESIAEYDDGSADIKEGTVLLVSIDGEWTLLHYVGTGDNEDGHPVVHLHYTDPTHGEEQYTRGKVTTKKFVYEYKPLPDNFKARKSPSYDAVMSYLRKNPKQLDLCIETDDEEAGKCSNIFIFKGCGELPTFWDDSDELVEMKEKYERVKSLQGLIDFSQLEVTPV